MLPYLVSMPITTMYAKFYLANVKAQLFRVHMSPYELHVVPIGYNTVF